MADPINETIAIASAEERLRQERETFDQRKKQDARWFAVRLAMGIAAIIIVLAVAGICGWIVVEHDKFTTAEVTIATSALFADILGLMISVWKIVLGPGPQALGPVTGEASAVTGKTPRRKPISAKQL